MWDIGHVILTCQKLVAGSRGMRASEQRNRAVVIVNARCDSVLRGQIDRLFRLENTAEIDQVRMDHGNRLLFEQVLESLGQVNVLAGADGRRAGILRSEGRRGGEECRSRW